MNTTFQTGLAYAKELDTKDELHQYREDFFIQPGEIYMDGNSLGMASKAAVTSIEKMIERWKKEGVQAWNDLYIYGEKISAEEINLVVQTLKKIVAEKIYEEYSNTRSSVV